MNLRTWGAIGVLAIGIAVGTAAYVAADDTHESHDLKDPDVPSPLTPATPTSTIDHVETSDIERARDTTFVSDGLQALDRALANGDAATVANHWVSETAVCFVGSDRTSGLCEGLAGEAGTRHEVDIVHMDLWGIDLRADRGLQLLHELLDGNSASLVLIANWENDDLVLGYSISPRNTSGLVDMRYLYIVAGHDGAVHYLGPLHQTPLEEWRNFDRPTSELIAIDSSISP
jgi:hypothetical protein